MAEGGMFNFLSLCAQEVRRSDWDRYLFTLFAPVDVREDLFTFLAFNAEIAKIANVVSDPLLGEIRLRWWQDAINQIYDGNSNGIQGHYILDNLPKVILERGLTKSLIDKIIIARSAEISSWPPKDELELLDYVIGTSSNLNILILEILGEKNGLKDKASNLGVAWGLTNLIRSFPTLVRLGRFPLPISLIAPDQNLKEFNSDLRQAIQAICNVAAEFLEKSRGGDDQIDKSQRSVFLSSSLTAHYLSELSNTGYNPYSIDLRKGRVRRQIIVGVTALLGNY